MKKKSSALVIATTSLLVAAGASAHVGAGTPVLTGNSSQEVTLTIGHGCEITGSTATADTLSLKVDIPAGVTNVRAISSTDFPNLTIAKDGAGAVTSITWAKPTAADSDSQYYKLTFRARMPNAPFTKIHFKAHQICKAPSIPAEWTAIPGDGSTADPAAEVTIMPAKAPGWNKYTVPVAVADLAVFFKDAQIVWKGSAAYSANAIIAAQITGETGVTALTALAANDEIFVKW